MAVDVRTETVIGCSRMEVAEYAANPDNAPKWYENLEQVEWKTPPPAVLGSRVAFVARFLGRRLAYVYEFVEFDPGRHLVMQMREGAFPMETTYTWETLGPSSTRMTLRNRGEPAIFLKLTAPIIAGAMRRTNQKDLARLKALIEAR